MSTESVLFPGATVEGRDFLLRHATERQWQDTILEAARRLNWTCYHTFDSRRSAPGFPDLCCVRAGGPLLFIEVKTERGTLTPAQRCWLGMLETVPGVLAMVARPSDWEHIESILRGDERR